MTAKNEMQTDEKSVSNDNITLKFQNLSVGYNGVPLQKPFSLSVARGEIISLIGANGAGKSTLLKTLIKEIAPILGAVFFDGRDVSALSHKSLAKSVSALLTVSVKSELMTCRDVVAAGRYPHTNYFSLLTAEDEAKIDEVISLVHAEDFADKDFMRVSDGQKQRILFARALCQNPSVLVLDEPTSYLDIKWRLELLSILRDLSKRGVTIIASLHEIDLALKISDRILCVGRDISLLSTKIDDCKAQIKQLYDLSDDFFETEAGYADLVSRFCEKQRGRCGGVRRALRLLSRGGSVRPRSGLERGGDFPLYQNNRAFPIMVQGTMSNAGKSFLVAGLCRIFKQDGFSVAPFKSQNMALNSFVTSEGLEMGRAQVMQAEAAGVEPSVLMNPILLKPTSDVGSQVIVNGEVVGNMSAKDYFAYKKSLVPEIKRAYERLSAEHDIIVIEGAGSPAEINLKENDIVNMGMAELADSLVLLVADIDRGGVFAQLVGTVELLTPTERSRVKGFIINKFRGDESILASGIKMLEAKTGIPVLGTIPYMKISLDDEDSLSENLHTLTQYRDKKDEIQLAVVRFPHISNFTDFIPLQNHPAVNLYYAEKPKDLGSPDAILLPGTKNTLADLEWLKGGGFAERIQSEAEKSTPIVGICGGFQMLGEKIWGTENGKLKTENEERGAEDNTECRMQNAEYNSAADCSASLEMADLPCVSALGLLPIETEFSLQKTRTRVSGKVEIANESFFFPLQNLPVSGYEIHNGRSRFLNGVECSRFSQITDSVSGEAKFDGAVRGNILGTYIHGLFDECEFTEKFVEILAKRRGGAVSAICKRAQNAKSDSSVESKNQVSGKSQIFNAGAENASLSENFRTFADFKESQYNLLASTLREHLDMKKIYEIMGVRRS